MKSSSTETVFNYCTSVPSSAKGNAARAISIGSLFLLTATSIIAAQPITVPNGSFESPPTAFVSVDVDSWQKAPEPDYFIPIETNGITWYQTAGVFRDTNPYVNRDGSQAAYMLSFPLVTLFQDYNSVDYNDPSPTHAFDATFQPGNSYKLTVGVYGKQMVEGYSSLLLSLYYRDGGGNPVTVGPPTTVTFSSATFPGTSPLSLVDFDVNIPTVQATNAWAGQKIGIQLMSLQGTGQGYWDMDNVRLTAVPEAASWTIIGLSAIASLIARRRCR